MDLEDTKSLSNADGQEIEASDIEVETKEISQDTNESDFEDNQSTENRETKENEIDKEFYDEILEKLDIKKKETKQAIQEIPPANVLKQESTNAKIQDELFVKKQLETAISQDFEKIQNLMKTGLINSAQGQNLKKQVLKKAFDKLVQTEKIKRNLQIEQKQNYQLEKVSDGKNSRENIFDEFNKSNPDFFNSEGRKEVLNYLKSDNLLLGKDELNKITEIVRIVEKSAIDRYLQKVAHEKTLKNSNKTAKQRLTANAQKSSFSKNFSRTFTREQIGKMSSAEFTKYESAIMEQLKKGHIK